MIIRSTLFRVSGFIKDLFFILKLETDFKELIRKIYRSVWVERVLAILFHGKILTIMWYCRKLYVLRCLGCNWCEVGLRGKVIRKRKREGFLKVLWCRGGKIFYSYTFSISMCFHALWCSPGMVRLVKKKTLMKPDSFDFNSLPATTIPHHYLITSPRILLKRKN